MSSSDFDFLKSSITSDSEVFSNTEVLAWIEERRNAIQTVVQQIPLNSLRNWNINHLTGDVFHQSGGFFSIEGIRVKTNWGNLSVWDQPIINQPEIGFLGFIAKNFNGVLHFFVQAKVEPGNINIVQISPTLQATRSNYSQIHKGKRPRYLEYFNGEKKVTRLLDQLQSEQGARFLRKRNRNIIVELLSNESVEPHDDFRWLTIGQIKELIKLDNVVNMDTRTVLSGINYSAPNLSSEEVNSLFPNKYKPSWPMLKSALNSDSSLNNFRDILSWITNIKSTYDLFVEGIPIKKVSEWRYENGVIDRADQKYFSVIGVNVSIDSREVVSWDQPMVKPSQEGLVAFIVRPVNGVYHFLVQAKLEAGNFDIIELAPTVQCLTGNYRTGHNEYSVPYINEILSAEQSCILLDVMQSEEGGRFFKEQNRNMIVDVGKDFPLEVNENYYWMTLNQLLRLIEFNNYLNIASRSLISAIKF
jgi:dTDP-4-dehydro-6-deoxy-alpha-D-glucopyranose 2,3-dehydratase